MGYFENECAVRLTGSPTATMTVPPAHGETLRGTQMGYADCRQWEIALARENIPPGERVAIMLRNCPEWVTFEQRCAEAEVVVVPAIHG